MILTKSGGILGPIASVLGIIMDFLFHITGQFGIFNVGLCIILFTIVTKMLMLPLTIKQQKSTKLMSVMNPEIQAIQAKYKGKNETPRNYCNKVTKSSKKGWFYNTVKITFNCATTQKQKPSKLNLDGSIKNRLSAIYITLCLSGLKRFD